MTLTATRNKEVSAPPGEGRPATPPPRGPRRSRRHQIRVLLVLASVALLIFGLTDTLLTQVRLHHAQVRLTQTHTSEREATNGIELAEETIRGLVADETVGLGTVAQLTTELAAATSRLNQAVAGLDLANFSVATVDNCLNGVQGAASDLEAGNRTGAVTALQSAEDSCELVNGATTGGPAYPYDFPDPDVIDVGGTYYAYGTNSASGNIQILESTTLTQWTLLGDALPRLASWARFGDTWAPGVIQIGALFYLYYAVNARGTECISVATSLKPQGPFTDRSTGPIVCQPSLGGSIDPSPYLDDAGHLYLTWKSNGAGGQPATIWAQPVAPGGTAMASGSAPVALLRPTQAWEGSVVEGPFMWNDHGQYFLFYSGNNWETGSYAEGVARCAGPVGPCAKPLPGPILGTEAQFAGPGGATVFTTPQGQPFIDFHGWQPDAVGPPNPRLLFIRPIVFENGYPVVGAPFT
jgi:Glycosyl hydrolases family 43